MKLLFSLQPFEEKLEKETDPDKKAMFERIAAKVLAALSSLKAEMEAKKDQESLDKAKIVGFVFIFISKSSEQRCKNYLSKAQKA